MTRTWHGCRRVLNGGRHAQFLRKGEKGLMVFAGKAWFVCCLLLALNSGAKKATWSPWM